jgi:hypothetical protein
VELLGADQTEVADRRYEDCYTFGLRVLCIPQNGNYDLDSSSTSSVLMVAVATDGTPTVSFVGGVHSSRFGGAGHCTVMYAAHMDKYHITGRGRNAKMVCAPYAGSHVLVVDVIDGVEPIVSMVGPVDDSKQLSYRTCSIIAGWFLSAPYNVDSILMLSADQLQSVANPSLVQPTFRGADVLPTHVRKWRACGVLNEKRLICAPSYCCDDTITPILVVDTNATVPSSTATWGTSDYEYISTAASWDDARAICQSGGADLVVFETAEEEQFLVGTFRLRQANIWCGCHIDHAQNGLFVWASTGEPCTRNSSYSNWGSTEHGDVCTSVDGVELEASTTKTSTGVQVVVQNEIAGGGWILYLYNGADAQHKPTLRFGANVAGYGSVATMPTTGGHKMNESLFDAFEFKEVLAIGSDGAWIIIRMQDGTPITASDAFAVHNAKEPIIIALGDGFGSAFDCEFKVREGKSTDGHGPFFHDALDDRFNWMWADHTGLNDLRKGYVIGGSDSAIGYTWQWYGRNHAITFAPENNCTAFESGSGRYWNDYVCEAELDFVCEKSFTSTTVTTTTTGTTTTTTGTTTTATSTTTVTLTTTSTTITSTTTITSSTATITFTTDTTTTATASTTTITVSSTTTNMATTTITNTLQSVVVGAINELTGW